LENGQNKGRGGVQPKGKEALRLAMLGWSRTTTKINRGNKYRIASQKGGKIKSNNNKGGGKMQKGAVNMYTL